MDCCWKHEPLKHGVVGDVVLGSLEAMDLEPGLIALEVDAPQKLAKVRELDRQDALLVADRTARVYGPDLIGLREDPADLVGLVHDLDAEEDRAAPIDVRQEPVRGRL